VKEWLPPKAPPSAYIIFFMEFLKRYPKSAGLAETANMAKAASAEWKTMSDEDKKVPILFPQLRLFIQLIRAAYRNILTNMPPTVCSTSSDVPNISTRPRVRSLQHSTNVGRNEGLRKLENMVRRRGKDHVLRTCGANLFYPLLYSTIHFPPKPDMPNLLDISPSSSVHQKPNRS
jgi:hypothetical protein